MQTEHSPCARAECPCAASFDGVAGNFCCIACRDGHACATGYHERPQQWPRAEPVDAPVEHGVAAVVDGEPMHPGGVAAAGDSRYDGLVWRTSDDSSHHREATAEIDAETSDTDTSADGHLFGTTEHAEERADEHAEERAGEHAEERADEHAEEPSVRALADDPVARAHAVEAMIDMPENKQRMRRREVERARTIRDNQERFTSMGLGQRLVPPSAKARGKRAAPQSALAPVPTRVLREEVRKKAKSADMRARLCESSEHSSEESGEECDELGRARAEESEWDRAGDDCSERSSEERSSSEPPCAERRRASAWRHVGQGTAAAAECSGARRAGARYRRGRRGWRR